MFFLEFPLPGFLAFLGAKSSFLQKKCSTPLSIAFNIFNNLYGIKYQPSIFISEVWLIWTIQVLSYIIIRKDSFQKSLFGLPNFLGHTYYLKHILKVNGYTECSLIIVFFRQFQNIFRTQASLGFSSVCTPGFMLGLPDGRYNTCAAAASELVEFRKITTF